MEFRTVSEERPWGWYEVVYRDDHTWTKILYVRAGERLSQQYHHRRSERWIPLDEGAHAIIGNETLDLRVGVCYLVPRETVHRIVNDGPRTVRILEVAIGEPEESDIVRMNDKYGRKE